MRPLAHPPSAQFAIGPGFQCEADHPETGELCPYRAVALVPLIGVGDLYLCGEHCS